MPTRVPVIFVLLAAASCVWCEPARAQTEAASAAAADNPAGTTPAAAAVLAEETPPTIPPVAAPPVAAPPAKESPTTSVPPPAATPLPSQAAIPPKPASPAVAAPTTLPPPAVADPPLLPEVREVEPSAYYLKDAAGNLVWVPNLSLEELHRLLELDKKQGQSGQRLPAYTFQDLSIQGTADQRQAQLSVVATIRLLTDEWVRVPLQFGGSVLREPARSEGEGDIVLVREGAEEGYIAWLRGQRDQRCQVSLSIKAPVEQVGNEMRLNLQVPRATSSQLDLQVPIPGARAAASNGLLDEQPSAEASRFVVAGLGGNFRIAWRKGEVAPADSRPLLEAVLEQSVKVDGVRQVTADVRIRVSSLRGEFDAFTVRLPSEARLFPRQFNQSGLQLTELADNNSGTRSVQVKLDRATAAPVEVQLVLEYLPAANGRMVDYDLGGIEVEDAISQSGTIDFVVKADLSLTWKPSAGVQRTFVPEPLRQKVTARFELTRRSYGLRMQVSTKETQVSVEPTYLLHVHSRRIQLEAVLKYRVRGTNLYGLNLSLPGWQVTQVGPESLLDLEALDRSRVEPMFIPLAPAAILAGGEFTLQVSAVKEIEDPAAGISLTLPRAEARGLAPATVVVLPADNVELTVSEERSQGLEREPFPPQLELPETQQRPLFYREISDSVAGLLVADLDVRQRSVSVNGTAEVRLDPRAIRVEQRFQYRVSYEPLRRLQFVMPRELLEAGDLRFLYDQQALQVVQVPRQEVGGAGPDADPWVQVQVDPLQELKGLREIVVQHALSLADLQPGRETPIDVPLVQPWLGDGTIVTGSSLRVQAGPEVSYRLDDQRWEPAAAPDSQTGSEGALWLAADSIPPYLSLQISRRDLRQQTSTLVQQAWIETRLGATVRRERAVFRLSTNQGHVAVQLPERAELERLGLDGRDLTNYAQRDQRTCVVEVPPGDEHVLELWYEVPRSPRPLARLELQLPQVVDAQSSQRLFWTLATPPDVHLLLPPDHVTPVLNWTWQGFYWGRTARLTPRDLERWIGATPQPEELPEVANTYLFSSLGTLGPLRVSLAHRAVLLIAVSGAALVIGLLLIYVAALRHPATLFVSGLVVFTAVVCYPDLAIALLQAALLGLLLASTAAGLKWWVDRHQGQGAVIQGTTYASPDSQTVEARLEAADSKAPPTTSAATVPAAIVESRV